MTDDKDNNNDAQTVNTVNSILSQVTATTDPANLGRLSSEASNLSSDNPKIMAIITKLQSTIEKKKEIAEGKVSSGVLEDNRKLEEQIRLEEEALAKQINEVREEILKKNIDNYKNIADDFHKQLDENHQLLEQAVSGNLPLTEEQTRRLTGEYATEEERKREEERVRKISANYKLAYQIKEHAEKSIEYRQGKIKDNDIEHDKITDVTRKAELKAENVQHQKVIEQHSGALKMVNLAFEAREKDRKILTELVKNNPKLAKKELQNHYKDHAKKYEEIKQQDPNHKGLYELQKLVQDCGGHEALGLVKPDKLLDKQQETQIGNIDKSATKPEEAKAIQTSRKIGDAMKAKFLAAQTISSKENTKNPNTTKLLQQKKAKPKGRSI